MYSLVAISLMLSNVAFAERTSDYCQHAALETKTAPASESNATAQLESSTFTSSLTLSTQALPKKRPHDSIGLVLGSTSLATLALGAGLLGAVGNNVGGVDTARRSDAERIAGSVLLGVGGALLAGDIVHFVIKGRKSTMPAKISVDLGRAAVLVFAGRFG